MTARSSPPALGGWTDHVPVAVLGFLCGSFFTVWAMHSTDPAISQRAAGAFALITALATIVMFKIREGDR